MNTFFEQVFNEARRSKTQEEFIEQARQVHPEYDYSKVNYVNATSKVIIICPKHGEFLMRPNHFLNGSGCPKCGRESASNKTSSNTDEFIEKAKHLHPEYDYTKVNYVNATSKVIISCPKHGEFLMRPSHLLRGSRCPKCSGNYIPTTDEFIERARQLHPEYDYSKVNYVNTYSKVIIICPKHGEFLITPSDFLKGGGCPKCSESKGERIIRNWLEKHNFYYERQCRLPGLKHYPYDFYLPKFNLLIEYNGEQHYKEHPFFHRKNGDFEGQLMRDHIKKDYAEKNGYDLLVIPYWEFKNIDKILSEKLLHVG